MDNLPAHEPVKAKLESNAPSEPPWKNQPGWHEPERLGIHVDPTLGDRIGGGLAIGLKMYIYDYVDFIGLCCYLGEGTEAQLITQGESPKVYDLRAPDTYLILSTWPRVFESNIRTSCFWTVRLLAGNKIWFDVDAWHWEKKWFYCDLPQRPIPPEIAELYRDFSDLLKIERRAHTITRRQEYPFSQWTDEEFARLLNSEHPLPKRTPEEIQALQEAAPILRHKIKALKTWAGRKSLGLDR